MAHDSNKRLKRKVRNSYIVSTVSIALVLFLLGTVGYLILNAMLATQRMKENVTVYVMLRPDSTDEQTAAIKTNLLKQNAVREATFVSKAEAAEEFREYAGTDFVEFLRQNPLPDSFEVSLNARSSEKETVRALETQIMQWPGVDEVVYQRNVIEQITSNINKFNLILLLFGGTLLFISLILLNNTIRVTIYSKRYIINTMKLVGATRWFILKPFLGSGILQGIYAGIIASLMFAGMVAGLSEGIPEVRFVAERFQIAVIMGGMLAGGVAISLLFTTFAVNKFIKMPPGRIHMY